MGKLSASTKKKKTVKVSWKKISKVKGYQICYSLSKKYKKAKYKFAKKNLYTIKKLKSKKKYYIRVRAYKLNGKTKVYGKWSKQKIVKVK